MAVYDVDKLMHEARKLAATYRRATGQALGISNEIAIHDVIRLMKLVPAEPGAGGYDAIGTGSREGKYIQIKGRTIFSDAKSTPRIGQIKMEQDWDSVMLILMNEDYEAQAIYEADREAIVAATDIAPNVARCPWRNSRPSVRRCGRWMTRTNRRTRKKSARRSRRSSGWSARFNRPIRCQSPAGPERSSWRRVGG